jgi:CubicO group peptidase (beta-lactamase class C family)
MAKFAEIDNLLRDAAASGAVPGVVAMAATASGIAYQGAFGRRVLPAGPDMTVDSVFWIASMTKAVTSTAALQLVERGKLTLDGPIADLLPELAKPQVLEGFDAAGEPKLRPARRPITLRHLLTHTAGFGYDLWNADLLRYEEKTGIPGIISCENRALTMPLTFDPGERWHYGINIDWAGRAVERASGLRLGDYFAEHLFNPLGMKDTAFKIGDAQRARLVGMHARQADGSLEPMPFELPQQPEFEMGGGGLYGTAADYLAFESIYLNQGRAASGRQILRPESLAFMTGNQMGALDVLPLKTAIPPYTNDAEFFPGMQKKWSLGFMLNTVAVPGGRSAGSLAWAGLGNTYFWIDPERGLAGVILMQLVPFADAKALDLLAGFERAVYKAIG